MVAENVDVAAGHSRCSQFLFSAPVKDRGGSAKCGLLCLKGPTGMGKISTAGVLRLRAIKRCVARYICEALRSG